MQGVNVTADTFHGLQFTCSFCAGQQVYFTFCGKDAPPSFGVGGPQPFAPTFVFDPLVQEQSHFEWFA